jgi:hypothetical protein
VDGGISGRVGARVVITESASGREGRKSEFLVAVLRKYHVMASTVFITLGLPRPALQDRGGVRVRVNQRCVLCRSTSGSGWSCRWSWEFINASLLTNFKNENMITFKKKARKRWIYIDMHE